MPYTTSTFMIKYNYLFMRMYGMYRDAHNRSITHIKLIKDINDEKI